MIKKMDEGSKSTKQSALLSKAPFEPAMAHVDVELQKNFKFQNLNKPSAEGGVVDIQVSFDTSI